MKTKLRKIVTISPPFDKRNNEPGKNYGIRALMFWMALRGKHGAVSVTFSTQYYPVPVIKEHIKIGDAERFLEIGTFSGKDNHTIQAWDIGFHSLKKPEYMKRDMKQENCDMTGKHCYYDGSSLRAQEMQLGNKFYEKGEEAIWEILKEEYKRQFEVEDVEVLK